jgi:hypothetical protein
VEGDDRLDDRPDYDRFPKLRAARRLECVLATVSWRIPSLWACSALHLVNNAWSGGLISDLARSIGPFAD